jgi:hypothetical protein
VSFREEGAAAAIGSSKANLARSQSSRNGHRRACERRVTIWRRDRTARKLCACSAVDQDRHEIIETGVLEQLAAQNTQ